MGTPEVARVVRNLRPRRGMSLVDLARAAEVPESELEAFEGRERPLSSSQLRRVAVALELEFAALMRGEAVEEPQPALFFRHFGSPDLHEGDRESLAATLREAEALAAVSVILDPDAGVRGEIVPARPGSTPYADGYVAARQLRRHLKIPTEALADVLTVLEDTLGILVRLAPLHTVSAMAVTVKDMRTGAAAVILNEHRFGELNGFTYRVTLAHELAHVLLDVSERPVSLVVEREPERGPGDTTPEEQRAGAFAAELLVPKEGVEALVGRPSGIFAREQALGCIEQVRRQFLVPVELTVNHLMNRGFIARDEEFRVHLIASANARGVEPPAKRSPGARNVRLIARVRRAAEEHRISANRARELLGLSVWEPLPWESRP